MIPGLKVDSPGSPKLVFLPREKSTMSYLRNLPSYLAVILTSMAFWSDSALACRCVSPDFDAAYRGASSIVYAEVLSVHKRSDYDATYTLAVSKAWKKDPGERIEVHSRSTCIYSVETGDTYLLFLRPYVAGGLHTNICFGNRRESDAEVWLHNLENLSLPKD
jgi:hypothetical protein